MSFSFPSIHNLCIQLCMSEWAHECFVYCFNPFLLLFLLLFRQSRTWPLGAPSTQTAKCRTYMCVGINGHTPVSIFTSAAAKSLQSCPTLCDPKDGSPPGSPIPGILQARTLEWVAISFSNAWKWKVKVKLLSRVRLLATPMDCSPPGSSIRGVFQARGLEWGAIFTCSVY